MVRPFDWRDINLVRRLGPQGICLDAETGLTRGINSLQTAMLAMMTPGMGVSTLVCRRKEDGKPAEPAFGQMRHRNGSEIARLQYLAPAAALSSRVGIELLEGLSAESGKRGAHNLLAEINEGDSGFETLRALSFAIYARQDIYRLIGQATATAQPGTRLRPQQPMDELAIRLLYMNNVPRLVQQVEPPPAPRRGGLVHAEADEVLGYFSVSRGPLGIWIEPYLHPAVECVPDLIARLVQMLEDRNGRPIYFCVRSYLDWVHVPLQKVGFELWAEQAVMVKRMAVLVNEGASVRTPVLEGGAKVTSPFVKTEMDGQERKWSA